MAQNTEIYLIDSHIIIPNRTKIMINIYHNLGNIVSGYDLWSELRLKS